MIIFILVYDNSRFFDPIRKVKVCSDEYKVASESKLVKYLVLKRGQCARLHGNYHVVHL